MTKIINVKTSKDSYPIYIEHGLKTNWASYIKQLLRGEKVAIITDSNVGPLYANELKASLENLNITSCIFTISAGEKSKSISNYENLATKLIEYNITRSDLIIALGGGVVGDLTGFVASTLLRGIDFIQIPTSLLAQIDSSVGGKVAVNLPIGKNLLGSFYHPKAVLIDPEVLQTLDRRVLSDGMAEVIKYACIKDESFFEFLEEYDLDSISEQFDKLISTCCQIKTDIVERDEKENNERMLLNFGHTFGHVIESNFNYEVYTHGEAVGLGMLYIASLGERLGLTTLGTSDKIKTLMLKYNLPIDYPKMDIEAVKAIISHDKKSLGEKINTIFIRKIGDSFIYPEYIDALIEK